MNDDSIDPSARPKQTTSVESEAANVAWFRRMVQPVLDTHAPVDGWADLRDDLAAHGGRSTPLASARRAAPALRRPRTVLVAAAAVLVAGAIGFASWPDQSADRRVGTGTTAPAPTSVSSTTGQQGAATTIASTVTVSDDPGPSQSPADAQRDSIVPELASLPTSVRASVGAAIPLSEGTWVLSRFPNVPRPGLDDVLGDPSGAYGRDFVSPTEYGEVLLLDETGQIVRAYPMSGVPPDWFYATDDEIYGGRIGDGGLPDSTIFRIDRKTFALRGIVLSTPEPGRTPAPGVSGWKAAAPDVDAAFGRCDLVDYRPGAVGTLAITTINPTRIDLDAISALFP